MYACKCGREFLKKQSFVAHCSHCKEHLNPEQQERRKTINSLQKEVVLRVNRQKSEEFQSKRRESIRSWISEEHKCETCGRIMTEYYGTGRFCGSSCSRSFSSKIAKLNPDSVRAFDYGRGKSEISPFELIVKEILDFEGIDYIHNATRSQYTDVKAGPRGHHQYVLDFYLKDYNVDIEVDGRLHQDHLSHDNERDEYLKSVGIRTFRIKSYSTEESIEDQTLRILSVINMKSDV